MTRILAITSGAYAAGKTLIAVNLATRLAQRGQRVCLLDAAPGPDSACSRLGLRVEAGFADLAEGGCDLQRALLHSDAGFDVLAVDSAADAFEPEALDHLPQQRLADCLAGLQDYDVILVDLAAEGGRQRLALACPELVLLVTPQPAHISAAYSCLKLLQEGHFSGHLRILVSRCADAADGQQTCSRLQQVAGFYLGYELPLLGVVREDESLAAVSDGKTPLLVTHPRSNASRDISAIASELQQGPHADAREYFNKYIQYTEEKEESNEIEMTATAPSPAEGRLGEQLESLAGQVEHLIAEIGRLRSSGPLALQEWLKARYPVAATATTSDDSCYPVYELERADGSRLRFACHSLDADVESVEPQSTSS